MHRAFVKPFQQQGGESWCVATEAKVSNQRLSIHYTLRQGYSNGGPWVESGPQVISERSFEQFWAANWKQYWLIYPIKCVRLVKISTDNRINYWLLVSVLCCPCANSKWKSEHGNRHITLTMFTCTQETKWVGEIRLCWTMFTCTAVTWLQ